METQIKPDRRRRSQKSRRALLKALKELLVQHPLTSISIEAIAERAGVGKQTIYRWYSDKSELFIDLYETESANRLEIPDMGSLEKELNELALRTWLFWLETASGQAFRQLIARSQSSPPALKKLRDDFMPKRRIFPEHVLNRAIARGEIKKGDYSSFIDLWIGFNWYHMLTNSLIERSMIPNMVSILLHGILLPAPKSQYPVE
jgi:AcrR family transcriptional regulator